MGTLELVVTENMEFAGAPFAVIRRSSSPELGAVTLMKPYEEAKLVS
jgi:hypothetical protein